MRCNFSFYCSKFLANLIFCLCSGFRSGSNLGISNTAIGKFLDHPNVNDMNLWWSSESKFFESNCVISFVVNLCSIFLKYICVIHFESMIIYCESVFTFFEYVSYILNLWYSLWICVQIFWIRVIHVESAIIHCESLFKFFEYVSSILNLDHPL